MILEQIINFPNNITFSPKEFDLIHERINKQAKDNVFALRKNAGNYTPYHEYQQFFTSICNADLDQVIEMLKTCTYDTPIPLTNGYYSES